MGTVENPHGDAVDDPHRGDFFLLDGFVENGQQDYPPMRPLYLFLRAVIFEFILHELKDLWCKSIHNTVLQI